jgi:hypothetical protein
MQEPMVTELADNRHEQPSSVLLSSKPQAALRNIRPEDKRGSVLSKCWFAFALIGPESYKLGRADAATTAQVVMDPN